MICTCPISLPNASISPQNQQSINRNSRISNKSPAVHRMQSRTEAHRSISNETPTVHRMQLITGVHRSLLFLYIPEHNDKYPVYPHTNSLTRPVVYDIPSQPQLPGYGDLGGDGSTAVKKKGRKWPCYLCVGFTVVVLLVVIIVPSVVTTRH